MNQGARRRTGFGIVLAAVTVAAIGATVLLGVRSAVHAGATQLLALIALLAVEGIAITITMELVARQVLRRPAAV